MHRESFSIRTWEKHPAPADRNLPLRQVLAAPGATQDHWPVPRRRTRMSRRGSCWRSTGRRPAPPGTPSREPRGCIVCSEPAGDYGNLGRRSRHTAPATARRVGRKVIHDYPRHFPEFLPLASSRRRPAGSRAVPPAAVIRPRVIQERTLGPRRGMIDTARIRSRPPGSHLCAMRGDEVGNCQIFHPLSH